MARQIDERVVEMRFDNSDFMKKVKPTISSLEKLKESLKLQDAAKGFDAMQQAANKVDMKGLGSAVDGVRERFSALETVALGALMRIGQRAIDAGTQLLNSLTVEPISQGFAEYELKMNSVQTIMASTGEDLNTVNQYLEELNHYADKTIYSFSDMTQNIGKFTNSGVELLDAVKAIQGVSNEAALAGANANEASRAMYNFAQALSAGYVKLIDWKSIENANMATVGFKEQLIQTAEVLGTVVKEGDDYRSVTTDMNGKTSDLFNATKNYNDSLSNQWLTTEVLVQTLSNYSTDIREMTAEEKKAYEEKLKTIGYTEEQIKQIEELGQKAFDAAQTIKTYHQLLDTLREAVGSGWAQTFEMIFGDFEEAKTLWTSVNEVVGGFLEKQAQARNDMIKSWKHLGGRDNLFQGLADTGKALLSVFIPIKDAFKEVFPPLQVQTLLKITNGIKEFAQALTISDQTADKIKRTFSGLFSIFDIFKQAITGIVSAFLPGVKVAGNFADSLLSITANIGDVLTSFDGLVKESGIFTAIGDSIAFCLEQINSFIDSIKEIISINFGFFDITKIFEPFSGFEDSTKDILGEFGDSLDGLSEKFAKAAPIFADAGKKIQDTLYLFIKSFTSGLSNGEFNGLVDLFNSGVLASIGIGISKFINNLSSFTSGNGGFLKGLKDIKDAIVETFETIQATLKADVLKKIAVSIAIFAASLFVLSKIDSNKLAGSLSALTIIMIELFGAFKGFTKASNNASILPAIKSLISFAAAILILSFALSKIASIDSDKIWNSLGVLTVMLGELSIVAIALSKYGGKIKTGTTSIIAFSAAIYILSASVEKLGGLDTDVLIKGLEGVAVLLAGLAAFMFAAKFGKFKPSQATSIILLSGALLILQKAVSSFGNMSPDELLKGIVAVGGILSEISLFNIASGTAKHVLSTSIGMMALAGAIMMLQDPLIAFSRMSLEQIGHSLLMLGGALGEIAIAMNLMPKNSLVVGLGLIAEAEGIILISKAMQSFSGMSWDDVAKGLTAMAIALGEVSIAANLMKGTSGGALSMILFAAAINLLVPALTIFSNMSWEQITKGIVALGGALIAVAIGANLLKPAIGALLAFALAIDMVALGISTLFASLALLLSADFLDQLAAPFQAVANELFPEFLKSLAKLVPELSIVLIEVFVELIDALCQAIMTTIPEIVRTIMVVVNEILEALVQYGPSIIHNIVLFIVQIINGITEDMPMILEAISNLLSSIFGAIIDQIMSLDPQDLVDRLKSLSFLVAFFGELALLAALAPAAMIGVAALGVLVTELAAVLAGLGKLMDIPGLSDFVDKGAELFEKIGGAIGGFIGNFVGELLSGVTSNLPQIALDLSMFMMNLQPFILGAKMIDSDMLESIKYLAEAILLITATDLIDSLTSWITGGTSLSDFGKSLSEFAPYFIDFANQTSGINGTNVKNCAEAMKTLFQAFSEIPNEGGLLSKIVGENALTAELGENVSRMGTSLAEFAEATKIVNSTKVKDSAGALEALFKAFKEIPNDGGLLGDIVGNNALSDELINNTVKMGSALAQFHLYTLFVDTTKVKNCAGALEALFQAFAEIPNEGGWIETITGANTLSDDFVDRVIKIGKALYSFYFYTQNVNVDTVNSASDALMNLFQAFSEIPNEGGIISWFTGDNDIATFGANLKAFGESFAAYYDVIDEIEFSTLSQAAAQVRSLIGISNSLAGMDNMYVIEDFAASLASISGDCLNGFIAAFGDENVEKAATAFTKLLVAIAAVIEERYETFYNYGIQIVTYWLDGMASTYESVIEAANLFIAQFMLVFDIMLVVFYLKGFSSATQFLSGFKFKYPEAFSTGRQLADQALSGIEAVIPEFYSAGERAGQGFVIGLESQKGAVEAAAAGLAAAAAAASASALDINSPSKVFKRQGGYAGEGFVLGMVSWTNRVAEAAARLGNVAAEQTASSVSSISQVLTDGISTDVVITPTFDLSGVKSSADEVNQMFNQSVRSLAVTAGVVSSSVDAATETKERTNIQNQPGDLKAGNNFTFIQNNTSPKALSRIDIYRQTRNQFSNFRREVGKG